MFYTVDVLEVDYLVVDVLELDVFGARQFRATLNLILTLHGFVILSRWLCGVAKSPTLSEIKKKNRSLFQGTKKNLKKLCEQI
jgi:hypothetical protein